MPWPAMHSAAARRDCAQLLAASGLPSALVESASSGCSGHRWVSSSTQGPTGSHKAARQDRILIVSPGPGRATACGCRLAAVGRGSAVLMHALAKGTPPLSSASGWLAQLPLLLRRRRGRQRRVQPGLQAGSRHSRSHGSADSSLTCQAAVGPLSLPIASGGLTRSPPLLRR